MTTRFPARCTAWGLMLAALALATGCNKEKPTGTVTGTVKYNGNPVGTGTVNFLSSTGAAAQVPVDESGNYKIDTPIEAGDYKVYVAPPVPGQLPPGTKQAPAAKFNVPQKYRDPASSGVTVTIKAGANTIPIELKD